MPSAPTHNTNALACLRRVATRLRHSFYALPGVRHCRRLRRLRPIKDGRPNGTPIVRHYWAQFLSQHSDAIHGRCLETGETQTLTQYGGDRVAQADAIDLDAHGPQVNVLADLTRADHVPADTYDCFVLPFTMHVIYDAPAALHHAIRILKPGGVLLVNFSCVDYYFERGLDMGTGAPLFLHWWFTPIHVENLLRQAGLREDDFQLQVYGNLFSRIAYQLNLPAEEMTRKERDTADPGHPLLICARIRKPAHWDVATPAYRSPWLPQTQPAIWTPQSGHYTT